MKSRSQRYDVNRSRPWHGQKSIESKMCIRIMMVICIKQCLSNM